MSNSVYQINRKMNAILWGDCYVLFWPHTTTRRTAVGLNDLKTEKRLTNEDFKEYYKDDYYANGLSTTIGYSDDEEIKPAEPNEPNNKFYEYPRIGEKVMCWQVVNKNGMPFISRGFSRFLYYRYYDEEEDKYYYKLFRDVYDPVICIDDSQLTMFYWTNVDFSKEKEKIDGFEFVTDDNVVHFDEKRFTLDNVANSSSKTRFNNNNLMKVRCSATGTIEHLYTKKGRQFKDDFINSEGDDEGEVDFVPVFERPLIIGYEFEEQDYESPSGYRGVPIVDFIPVSHDYGCIYGNLSKDGKK